MPRAAASATALAPRECATIARAGPCARTKALHRFGALDDRRAPGLEGTRIGVVVAGQVERDDPVSGLDKRFDEDSEVRAAAAPAMHQIHRGSIAPRLPRDPVSGPGGLDGLARRDAWRHAQAHLHGGRGAPQLDGPLAPTAGAKRSSSPNARRTLGATGGSTPEPASSAGNPGLASHQQSPSYRSAEILLASNKRAQFPRSRGP